VSTIFSNGAGQILSNGALEVAASCCCATTTVNPCAPDPSIVVSVTGGSGTINWCGETWNLPGDSGVEKTVCPTFYAQYTYSTTIFHTVNARHQWNNAGLQLQRIYHKNYPAFSNSGSNVLVMQGLNDTVFWYGSNMTGNFVIANSLGLITISPPGATLGAYLITNDFFGSHVISGVTYSWSRGQGWP